MTGSVVRVWSSTQEEWRVRLEGQVPAVEFGYAGFLQPDHATVVLRILRETSNEETAQPRSRLTIHLDASNQNHVGNWGAPEALAPPEDTHGYGGGGHIRDLPEELLELILSNTCGTYWAALLEEAINV